MSAEIKVLVVDDSRIFRKQIESALAELDGVVLSGSVWNGKKAIEAILEKRPDLVTLDMEMPEMDGLQTLAEITKLNLDSEHKISVVMISSHTRAGADATMKALSCGAFDFIPKPNGESLEENFKELKQGIKEKIRALKSGLLTKSTSEKITLAQREYKPSCLKTGVLNHEVIGIGISTGGPRALQQMLPKLCDLTELPVLVVQHMPKNFTASLAHSLDLACSHEVIEAKDGMEVIAKTIYIAPGGQHLLLRRHEGKCFIKLNEQEPENGFRPSADVLFRSMANVYGPKCIAVIMTGMGSDGTKGLMALGRQNACIIAQDKSSSVVWGMPGSAVAAGVVNQVVPLEDLAQTIAKAI